MRPIIPLLVLLAACAPPDPRANLTPTQRACLAQVEQGIVLDQGETLVLTVDLQGKFAGAVLRDGLERRRIDPAPYNACMAGAAQAQALAGYTEIAPGVMIDAADKALWDTMTPAQRQRGLEFIANGSTLAASMGDA
jgi:hypothetical protein